VQYVGKFSMFLCLELSPRSHAIVFSRLLEVDRDTVFHIWPILQSGQDAYEFTQLAVTKNILSRAQRSAYVSFTNLLVHD